MQETVQIWPNNGGGAEGKMLADITLRQLKHVLHR